MAKKNNFDNLDLILHQTASGSAFLRCVNIRNSNSTGNNIDVEENFNQSNYRISNQHYHQTDKSRGNRTPCSGNCLFISACQNPANTADQKEDKGSDKGSN